MTTENLQPVSSMERFWVDILKKLSRSLIAFFNYAMKYHELIFAFVTTLIFFLPSLQANSLNAGLLYTGDILGYYVPVLIKTHALIASHHFTAIDYSLFNGSSDFFLNANFFPLHPLVILHSLFASFNNVSNVSTGHFLVLMLALHTFLACYFSLKLFSRYFQFEFGMTMLVALGFAFSWYSVAAMGEPPFMFCASIIPWTVYAALRFAENPSLKKLILGTFPVTIAFLGGYLPMGLAALLLSSVLITTLILFIDKNENNSAEQRVQLLIMASLPFLSGLLVTSPYLYSVYQFHHMTTGAASPNLFYSAHQLADLPQSFIRLISSHFVVPGPSAEFSVYWGIIALTTFAIFFLSPVALAALNEREWRIFKVAGMIYFATVLAIYGEHSVVSSFVYYLVPQIGTMHIYQRFLQPAELLFMVMIALMLKAIIQSRPKRSIQVALIILGLISFAAGSLMTFRSEYALMYGINNHLMFELLLGCLFTGILLIPGKSFVYSATAILFCLPAFNSMYTMSLSGNTFTAAEARQPMALNQDAKASLLQYLKRFEKPIIKYVDMTPVWNKAGVETFPKDFPYLVLNEVNLSSYGGATFYLSALAKYIHRMPVGGNEVTLNPDWHWLQETGADFLIATKEAITANETIHELAVKNKPEDLYYLPNDAVLIPLKFVNNANDAALFNNGYFRIYPSSHFANPSTNLALHKLAWQSGEETGAPAQRVVDGNTDGNFAHGTVSHTSSDPNAWLDIDIGKSDRIDSIKIWNRTDCCGERLNHYWVFISNTPFLPTEKVEDLRHRIKTWGVKGFESPLMALINTGGVEGRYVRIQFSGTASPADSYLSLAEVEVLKNNSSAANTKDFSFVSKNFYSNNANTMRMAFESNIPTTIQYLFWDNPRIHYYLNGKKAVVHHDNGLMSINAPAGNNIIEVRYVHWPLILFWIFYGIFGVFLVWALIPKRFIIAIISILETRRGAHGS